MMDFKSLSEVVAWGLACVPKRIVEIVTQDEYTHDVLLPNGDGSYLVWDTT